MRGEFLLLPWKKNREIKSKTEEEELFLTSFLFLLFSFCLFLDTSCFYHPFCSFSSSLFNPPNTHTHMVLEPHFFFLISFLYFVFLHAHTQGKKNKGLKGETYGERESKRFDFSLKIFLQL
jgi:hypothetical protein